MRKFEVVRKDAIQYGELPQKMPVRATKHSAGYDIYSPISTVIEPNSMQMIWTNVSVCLVNAGAH